MIPLSDGIPARRFPIVNVALIVAVGSPAPPAFQRAAD
jgi:hypothetical protein